jgi:predicted phosphate transport protein (TIGR00153 family)
MRLTPSNKKYYELFSLGANNIVDVTKLLARFVEELPAHGTEVRERMREFEHAGDDITHQVMSELNSSFVTPFDREDIYRLAVRLDDIVDNIDAAVDLAIIYQIDAVPGELAEQADLLVRAAEETAGAMPRLASMKDLQPYWVEINRLENAADKIYRNTLGLLFSGKFDALTVLKIKDVVDSLEQAADGFEHVADTVQTIVVKES